MISGETEKKVQQTEAVKLDLQTKAISESESGFHVFGEKKNCLIFRRKGG